MSGYTSSAWNRQRRGWRLTSWCISLRGTCVLSYWDLNWRGFCRWWRWQWGKSGLACIRGEGGETGNADCGELTVKVALWGVCSGWEGECELITVLGGDWLRKKNKLQYHSAVPCKFGCHGKAIFNPPSNWPRVDLQNSVSKSELKITTKNERDIEDDPRMRSDFGQTNSKSTFDR